MKQLELDFKDTQEKYKIGYRQPELVVNYSNEGCGGHGCDYPFCCGFTFEDTKNQIIRHYKFRLHQAESLTEENIWEILG